MQESAVFTNTSSGLIKRVPVNNNIMGYWFQGRHNLSPTSQEGFPKAPGWWMFPEEQFGKEGHLFMCTYSGLPPYKPQSMFITNTCLLTGQALGRSSRQAQSESAWKNLLLEVNPKVQVSMPPVRWFPFSGAANNPLVAERLHTAHTSSLWDVTHWSPLWHWSFRWLVSSLNPQSLLVRLDLLLRRG